MKNSVILTLAALMLCGCSKDDNEKNTEFHDNYYWAGSEKIPLEKVLDRYFIIFQSGNAQEVLERFTKNGFVFEKESISNYYTDDYEHFPDILKNCMTVIIDGNGSFPQMDGIMYCNNLYQVQNRPETESGWSNYFYIGLKSEADTTVVKEYAKRFKAYIVGNNYEVGHMSLICTKYSDGNNIELANWFYETGEFQWATPEIGTFY